MANIQNPILERKFELVRVAVGAILADELANQATLQPDVDTLQNVSIFDERNIPIPAKKMPAIVISYFQTVFENKERNTGTDNGNNEYWIDVYTKGKGKQGQEGDAVALQNCQRLMGVIQAILTDPVYVAWKIDRNLLINTMDVTTMVMAEIENNQEDSFNVAQGRITLKVVATETLEAKLAIPLVLSTTNVKLFETEVGLQYISEFGDYVGFQILTLDQAGNKDTNATDTDYAGEVLANNLDEGAKFYYRGTTEIIDLDISNNTQTIVINDQLGDGSGGTINLTITVELNFIDRDFELTLSEPYAGLVFAIGLI